MKRILKSILVVVMTAGLIISIVPQMAVAAQKLEGVTLSRVNINLTVGDKMTIKVLGAPKSAKVTWKSNKKSIASVSTKGKVTAKKPGEAVITATVKSGKKSASLKCAVTVMSSGVIKTPLSIKDSITIKDLKEKGETVMNIDFRVPSITIKGNKKATETINRYIKAERDSWYSTAKEFYKDYLPSWIEMRKEGLDLLYSEELFCENTYHRDNLLSLNYSNYSFLGGPHPNTYFFSQVFDLSTGELVEFSDIVKDKEKATEFVYDRIKEAARREYIEYEYEDDYIDDMMAYIDDNLTFFPSPDGKWSIDGDSMCVTFSSSELRPYAEGILATVIDLSDFTPYLNDYGKGLLLPAMKMDAVSLESNPSTGFSWYISYSEEGIVECNELKFTQEEMEEVLDGAGGMMTWTIKPVSQGMVTVTFEYRRGWDEDSTADTISIDYYVDSQGLLHALY